MEFRLGGRKVSLDDFIKGLEEEVLAKGLTAALEMVQGKAAAIVDPETGKHPLVIARRVSEKNVILKLEASSRYKSILNTRLGNEGSDILITNMSSPAKLTRHVYLAHASEDADLAERVARGLISRGIEVWYSEWEIGGGDSLKRKMEEGLENCTHFVVLLSSTALPKPWVNEEIDAGFLRQVEGQAKFIGVRVGTAVSALSVFLRTRHCPALGDGEAGLDKLAATIFDVSQKPALGTPPQYVQDVPPLKEGWSASALAIAKHMCINSAKGDGLDTVYTVQELFDALGIEPVDIEIGLLDLTDSGLLRTEANWEGTSYLPESALYYEFDDYALGTNPVEDAKSAARFMASTEESYFVTERLGESLGWSARRMNPAIAYLIASRVVEAQDGWGGEGGFHPSSITTGTRLARFVRDNP